MTVARRITQVFHGPTAAGQILAPTINAGFGVPAAMASTFSGATSLGVALFGGDTVSNVAYLCGYRVQQAMDLSSRDYVYFAAAHNNMSNANLQTLANGGIRIVFQDGGGNWAAFNIHGKDFGTFSANADGALAGYAGFANNYRATGAGWMLSRDYTPAASSGVLDWSNIAAFEVHFSPLSSMRCQLSVGRFATVESPPHTGNVSGDGFYADIDYSYGGQGISGAWPLSFIYSQPQLFTQGAKIISRALQLGFQVGDGVTPTALTLANDSIVFWHLPEDNRTTEDVPLAAILLATPRLLDFFQSASDSVTFTDCVISTTRRWGVRVRGNAAGICEFNRVSFWSFERFDAGHGKFVDCQFNDGYTPISVTTATTITRGTIRGAKAATSALRIDGGPGTYSGVDVTLDNAAAVADVLVGAGGAGTYSLPNIKVPAGYTLKVRNESASAAVVVQVPAGLTTSTSTAGGTITVESAPFEYTIVAQVPLTGAEVRVYDLDNIPAGSLGSELGGTESAGATYTFYAQAGNSVWLQIMAPGFEEYSQQYTTPAQSTTITVTLQPELNT